MRQSFGKRLVAVIGALADLVAGFPAVRLRASSDAERAPSGEADSMQTYAVYWTDPAGERCAGRVALCASFAELDGGSSDGRLRSLRIGFEEIASVRYQHGLLHVWRRDGPPVRLGSVDAPGALRELAERLKSQLATRVA
jgi:hypothetical protein